MPLIKEGDTIADTWRELSDDDELPDSGDVTVSLGRFLRDPKCSSGRSARLGVRLPNTEDPMILAPHLGRLDLIALDFPAFTDGRAYSQARVLRSRLGFKGELRATGNVLADQAAFMRRCGIDTFEVDAGLELDTWRRASLSMTRGYQRGFDEPGLVQRANVD